MAIAINYNGTFFSSIRHASSCLKISTRKIQNALNDPTNKTCYKLDISQLSTEQRKTINTNTNRRGKDKSRRIHGQNHKNWVHGFGKTRNYDPQKYSSWKSGVLKLYDFRCIISGSMTDLECHHLNGWWFEDGRYDIYNGVPLSREIHKKFHQLYGNGQNTQKQFEVFLQNECNIVFKLKKQHGNHEPSISIKQLQEQAKTFRVKKFSEIEQLVLSRDHIIQEGEYQNIDSPVLIYCLKHNYEHQTTYRNYKRSRTGMPCCSKERQKNALEARPRNLKGQVLRSKESKLD